MPSLMYWFIIIRSTSQSHFIYYTWLSRSSKHTEWFLYSSNCLSLSIWSICNVLWSVKQMRYIFDNFLICWNCSMLSFLCDIISVLYHAYRRNYKEAHDLIRWRQHKRDAFDSIFSTLSMMKIIIQSENSRWSECSQQTYS